MRHDKQRRDGYDASVAEQPITDCPYDPMQTGKWLAWKTGWYDYKRAQAANMEHTAVSNPVESGEIFKEGYLARLNDAHLDNNPYSQDYRDGYMAEWARGWMKANRDEFIRENRNDGN